MVTLRTSYIYVLIAVFQFALCINISSSVAQGSDLLKPHHITFDDKVGTQWSPYIEWDINYTGYSGNPYDVIADATFVHEGSGTSITTGMFYAENDLWKFRFAGTKVGRWNFTTASTESGLSGHNGSVTIQANSNPNAPGFVTNYGNKWGRVGTEKAFVPQFVMYSGPHYYHNKAQTIDSDIQTFLAGHGFTGFHTPVFCRWFDITQSNCNEIAASDPNPDSRTFEALELLITRTYDAGGLVHIWMWGDDERGMSPGRWGINGNADKRLQRYISARLSPLPGWTMGYGFDLWEWSSQSELDEWHSYMHQHQGWPHYLGARAQKNTISQISELMDYSGYEQHKPNYNTYVASISDRSNKPSFSEDRFRVRDEGRSKDYTETETRRGLWHSAMAGGVANIWGNLIGASDANLGTVPSAPYLNPVWIKTNSTFATKYFTQDLGRCNELSNGYCLKTSNDSLLLFYIEDRSSIQINLTNQAGLYTIYAVDTLRQYNEVNLGVSQDSSISLNLPHHSDWAVILLLSDTQAPTNTPTATPTNTSLPPTSTPTVTPTNTSVGVPINTPTATPTNTSLPPTDTPTVTPTNTSVGVSTNTPTPTWTPIRIVLPVILR